MTSRFTHLALALLPFAATRAQTVAQHDAAHRGPDTVIVHSGSLALRALLWRPAGRGPFPAVLCNHGGGNTALGADGRTEIPIERTAELIAPTFVRHGYVFLFPLRRGVGLSSSQGTSSSDRWQHALATSGQEARNRLQLELLETVELDDALAALRFLRGLPEVDARRVAVVGHSFGGSLTLLVAERDSALRAAVIFAGAALSWPASPALRARLLAAVSRTAVPIFFVFAANDYSVAPGEELSAAMARLGKPHRLKIYPAAGRTPREGHSFAHTSVSAWERDVFDFLDPLVRQPK
jgi:dienelactone hydrolase